MTCLYCGAECQAMWSPADAKADKFPACNREHAYALVNRPLLAGAWGLGVIPFLGRAK